MLTILIVILDQIIKNFVVKINPQICIITDIFGINYTKNTGGIYGVMQNSNLLFIVLAVAILVIFSLCYKYVKDSKIKKVLWQIILAGGMSNLLDRIFRGFVVDFVSLKFFGVFNTSDACIVISVIILIFMELCGKNECASQKKENSIGNEKSNNN